MVDNVIVYEVLIGSGVVINLFWSQSAVRFFFAPKIDFLVGG
jgi:hypothetical protein